jgi:hypothetical protein
MNQQSLTDTASPVFRRHHDLPSRIAQVVQHRKAERATAHHRASHLSQPRCLHLAGARVLESAQLVDPAGRWVIRMIDARYRTTHLIPLPDGVLIGRIDRCKGQPAGAKRGHPAITPRSGE